MNISELEQQDNLITTCQDPENKHLDYFLSRGLFRGRLKKMSNYPLHSLPSRCNQFYKHTKQY